MEAFHARHIEIFEPHAIEEKSILFVGCGSVGSMLAEFLVRSGVKRFRLVDPDWVSPPNLSRSAFRQADLGATKVDALRRSLLAIRPTLEIEVHPQRVDEITDEALIEWISVSALVVAATDDPTAQARLSKLAYPRVPAIFPAVYAKGIGGEVLWTAPDETPCYSCVLAELRGASAPDRGQTDYGVVTGQLASEPALGIDILHVTVCAAKIALALLLRGTGSRVEAILNPVAPLLFVGNSAEWLFRAPFETVWARVERRDGCVCRLSDGSSTADLFTAKEMLELEATARRLTEVT